MIEHFATYLPHGWCFRWEPWLIALHLVGNLGIWLAYTLIPITMGHLLWRHRALPLQMPPRMKWIVGGYIAFILLCGITHLLQAITIFQPIYWIEGWVGLLTAVVSLGVFGSLYFTVPMIVDFYPQMEHHLREDVKAQAQATLDGLWAENRRLAEALRLREIEMTALRKLAGAEGS